MAKIRSGARHASRHDGRQYDSGFQFRNPQREVIELGPWESVWPLGERKTPKSVLRSLQDGILRDGIIFPLWSRSTSTVNNGTILGAGEFAVGSDIYSLIFFRNLANSNRLSVKYDNGAGDSGTDDSAVAFTAERVAAASWGIYVYITQPALGSGALRYDVVANTFTAVATIPNGKFMFVLDNNLLVVREVAGVWYLEWSVDSSLEDFSSAGSGSAPITAIGEIMGVGVLEDRAIIVGKKGAKLILPTGTASPAFRMMDIAGIRGTPFDYAVTSDRMRVFYIDYNGQVVAFTGSAEANEVGMGEGKITADCYLWWSTRLGLLVASCPSEDQTLFLDTQRGMWVSNLAIGFSFFTDGPTDTYPGRCLGYVNDVSSYDETVMDLAPDAYNVPMIGIGKIELGREWYIEYVEIIRTNVDSPGPPEMDVSRTLFTDTIEVTEFGSAGQRAAVEQGHNVLYYVSAPARTILMDLEGGISSGPYLVMSINASGNVPVNLSNPPSGYAGDLNAAGNLIVAATSNQYISDGTLNANGNMDMVASPELWDKDYGIEGINVVLQALEVRA